MKEENGDVLIFLTIVQGANQKWIMDLLLILKRILILSKWCGAKTASITMRVERVTVGADTEES